MVRMKQKVFWKSEDKPDPWKFSSFFQDTLSSECCLPQYIAVPNENPNSLVTDTVNLNQTPLYWALMFTGLSLPLSRGFPSYEDNRTAENSHCLQVHPGGFLEIFLVYCIFTPQVYRCAMVLCHLQCSFSSSYIVVVLLDQYESL